MMSIYDFFEKDSRYCYIHKCVIYFCDKRFFLGVVNNQRYTTMHEYD